MNSEMHLQVVIKGVRRCAGRPRPSTLREASQGRDRTGLEIHLQGESE